MKKIVSILLVLAMLMGMAAAVAEENDQKLNISYDLAIDYITDGDYENAMLYLDKCMEYCTAESNPAIYADVLLKKGCVYTMTKQYDEALAEIDKVLAVNSELAEAYLVQAQIYTEQGNYETAADVLQTYIDMTGDSVYYQTIVELKKMSGDEEGAANVQAEKIDAPKALYEGALAKMEEGLYEEAIADFNVLVNDGVYGGGSCYCAGVCYINLGEYAKALTYLEAAVVLGVTIDGIYYNCGLCRMMAEDYVNAVTYYTASILYESFVTDATYNRAVCLLNNGNYAEAEADFTAYLDAKTQEGPAAIVEDEDYDKAIYFRGLCCLMTEKYEEAVTDLETCLAKDYLADECRENLALCYLQLGRYEEALTMANECIEKELNVVECTYYRAVANANLGNLDESIADFTTCIENEYDLFNMYNQRAQVYKAKGDDAAYRADMAASLNY